MCELISVVIPLYNKENYISRTIESVLVQSFKRFEILVIDDGSSDNGPDLIRKFKDPRIKLIVQKNAGVSAARNSGIRASAGGIIAFLDADDVWEKEYLENINMLANDFPEAGFFATGYRRKYPNFIVDVSIDNSIEGIEMFVVDNYFKIAVKYPFIHTSSIAVKKNVLENVGLFKVGISIGEDQDLWARIALKYKLAYCNKVLSVYYCENSELVRNRTKKQVIIQPIVETIKNHIYSNDKNNQSYADDLIELANKKILESVADNISIGDIDSAKAILKNELIKCERYPFKYYLYHLSIPILPAGIIHFLDKALRSKIFFTFHKKNMSKQLNIKMTNIVQR